jgi:hypothetical protein
LSFEAPVDPPARAKFLVERGLALYGRGDVAGAVRHWLAAREADPDNLRAQEYLAFVAENDGVDASRVPPDPERLQLSLEEPGPPRPLVVPQYIPNPPEASVEEEAEETTEVPTAVAPPPVTPPPAAPPAHEDPELSAWMEELRERERQDDFSGTYEAAERILQRDPESAEAHKAQQRAAENLIRIYESKLGNLKAVPVVRIPADEVIWLNLSHREGFILSQVDGQMRYDDILDVCGMPRLEALRILVSLQGDGVIGPAPQRPA